MYSIGLDYQSPCYPLVQSQIQKIAFAAAYRHISKPKKPSDSGDPTIIPHAVLLGQTFNLQKTIPSIPLTPKHTFAMANHTLTQTRI